MVKVRTQKELGRIAPRIKKKVPCVRSRTPGSCRTSGTSRETFFFSLLGPVGSLPKGGLSLWSHSPPSRSLGAIICHDRSEARQICPRKLDTAGGGGLTRSVPQVPPSSLPFSPNPPTETFVTFDRLFRRRPTPTNQGGPQKLDAAHSTSPRRVCVCARPRSGARDTPTD